MVRSIESYRMASGGMLLSVLFIFRQGAFEFELLDEFNPLVEGNGLFTGQPLNNYFLLIVAGFPQ